MVTVAAILGIWWYEEWRKNYLTDGVTNILMTPQIESAETIRIAKSEEQKSAPSVRAGSYLGNVTLSDFEFNIELLLQDDGQFYAAIRGKTDNQRLVNLSESGTWQQKGKTLCFDAKTGAVGLFFGTNPIEVTDASIKFPFTNSKVPSLILTRIKPKS